MKPADVVAALSRRLGGLPRTELLRDLTTWRIGGPAAVVDASGPGVLADALGAAVEEGLPVFVLGRGSNLLAPDEGWGGLVIRLCGAFSEVRWLEGAEGCTVEAGAAARLPGLAGAACMRGASGLAFAAGIPGSLGGAVYMNAGAHGSSISDLVREVRTLSVSGEARVPASECGFGYRTSAFAGSGAVVTGVVLALGPGDPAELRAEASAILRRRRETLPLDLPSAGSVFRRCGEAPPGRLIEECGLKGLSRGGAQVSRRHANFIVNTGGATAADVGCLVEVVRNEVRRMTGVRLVEEIVRLGGEGGPGCPG